MITVILLILMIKMIKLIVIMMNNRNVDVSVAFGDLVCPPFL